MTRRVVVTAPGKVILMGEHAAVYGRPAVVAALDLRTTVELEERPAGIELDLPTIEHRATTDWPAIEDYTAAYAERWRRFDAEGTSEAFARLADRDPARVVRLALGEARRALGRRPVGGLRLRVSSAIPVGSGFGSSASVATAVAGALLTLAGEVDPGVRRPPAKLLSTIAFEVERRQHGRPSGVDHATVLRGGILRIDREAERAIAPIDADPEATESLRIFDTGPPVETTGEVVAAVRSLENRDPEAFGRRLEVIAGATRSFAAALAGEGGVAGMTAAVRTCQRCLEELGIVPPPVRRTVRRLEEAGGAAKISGAGTLSGDGAGALLVCWPPSLAPRPDEILAGYPCHRAAIGGPGFRLEEQV